MAVAEAAAEAAARLRTPKESAAAVSALCDRRFFGGIVKAILPLTIDEV